MKPGGITRWIKVNHDTGWDVLRVYIGIALFVKGLVFLHDLDHVRALIHSTGLSSVAWLAEPIAVTHMAGGVFLCFGLWTRLAAAVQIPILAGAVFFVHLKDGLFSDSQSLELALLVLMTLCLFALGGAGRLSIDAFFRPGTRIAGRKLRHADLERLPAGY